MDLYRHNPFDLRIWGAALPFQNAVEGARAVLFGSYSVVLGRCIGVLFGMSAPVTVSSLHNCLPDLVQTDRQG